VCAVLDGASSEPGRPARFLGQRALEGAALALAGVLLAALAWRLTGRVDGGRAVGVLGVAALAGYLLADVVSGLAHWFGDRFFEEDTPVIGRIFIEPFREHHRDPRAMTRHSALELLGNSALGSLPILAAAWWSPSGIFLDGLTIAFTAAAIATNQFHAWAHAPRRPPAVAWLQARGLILSPARHARHHRRGHDHAYCMTTGWLNRWMDDLRIFVALERVLRALGVPATRTG
jgi:ubiquitin-conjugating enzyme E2 variant